MSNFKRKPGGGGGSSCTGDLKLGGAIRADGVPLTGSSVAISVATSRSHERPILLALCLMSSPYQKHRLLSCSSLELPFLGAPSHKLP